MLDRRPERAQAPIVSGRNCTLAAARMSAASPSVIQSAAAGTLSPPSELEELDFDEPDPEAPEPDESDRDESEREESERDESERDESERDESERDESDLEPDPVSADPAPPSDLPPFEAPPSPPDSLVFDPEALAARVELELARSFFAQPDPLKWIVGGANTLRIVFSRPHDWDRSAVPGR